MKQIDPHIPLPSEFDLIVVKPQKELNNVSWEKNPSPPCVQVIDNIQNFIAAHPSVAVIDPLEGQKQLISRESMKQLLEKIETDTNAVKFPASFIFQNNDSVVLPSTVNFPVICKSLVAGGSAASHQMGIVFNEEGINSFPKPVIVQELINHDATIFKAFVIGDFVSYVRKASLPNYVPDPNRITINFDSQSFADLMGTPVAPEPSFHVVKTVADAISRHTGLSLFGFDLITKSGTTDHFVIDINYFPSYKGIDGFYDKLVTLIIQKIREKKM